MSGPSSLRGSPSSGFRDERELIELLFRGWPRSPLQLNGPWEADAELLWIGNLADRSPQGDGGRRVRRPVDAAPARRPGDVRATPGRTNDPHASGPYLAVTTDSICEEIESGLYTRPDEIGWMAVTVSASDLAAAGAEPVGLLLNVSVPEGVTERFLAALGAGVRDAARAYGLPVLGGDMNRSSNLRVGSTGLGLVSDGPVTRIGARPGHLLYTTGPPGLGASVAFRRLLAGSDDTGNESFRPLARLREGAALRRLASACVDTSDGLVPALGDMFRPNRVGAVLDPAVRSFLHEQALEVSDRQELPPWIFLCGPHGDYELLFTVPAGRRVRLERLARREAIPAIPIGRIVEPPGLELRGGGATMHLDPGEVTGLFDRVRGDPARYLKGLLGLHSRVRSAARQRFRGRSGSTSSARRRTGRPAALPSLEGRRPDSPPTAPIDAAAEDEAREPRTEGESHDEAERPQAGPPRPGRRGRRRM